jgi:hypothetical protein
MCDHCRDMNTTTILQIASSGVPLDAAVECVRGIVLKTGLSRPDLVKDIGTLQKLSDDIDEAGDRLRRWQQVNPIGYCLMVADHAT